MTDPQFLKGLPSSEYRTRQSAERKKKHKKKPGDRMHNCKRVESRIRYLLEEIEKECEPDCNKLDWEYISYIKPHLMVIKGITERWIRDFNKQETKFVYTGIRKVLPKQKNI